MKGRRGLVLDTWAFLFFSFFLFFFYSVGPFLSISFCCLLEAARHPDQRVSLWFFPFSLSLSLSLYLSLSLVICADSAYWKPSLVGCVSVGMIFITGGGGAGTGMPPVQYIPYRLCCFWLAGSVFVCVCVCVCNETQLPSLWHGVFRTIRPSNPFSFFCGRRRPFGASEDVRGRTFYFYRYLFYYWPLRLLFSLAMRTCFLTATRLTPKRMRHIQKPKNRDTLQVLLTNS